MGVGDPMLDLVGLMVGGVIAAFDQVGSDDGLEDALAALKETPRSRDRPVYRAYEFERRTVRAGKEATIGVALRDLERGRTWRSEVRQREMRQLFVLEGLDPRDRDYEQHRAGAMSQQEFEHWQRQPPQLPMSALVAALVDQSGTDQGPPHRFRAGRCSAPAAAAVDWLAAGRGRAGKCDHAARNRGGRAERGARYRHRYARSRERWSPKMRSPGSKPAQLGGRRRSEPCWPRRSIRGRRAWCGSRRGAAAATVSTSGRGWSSPRPIWSAARR